MIERYAPAGKIWFCMMCGKTTKDCCTEERGWDESCALNCILVDETTKQPTQAQVEVFGREREQHFAAMMSNIEGLRQKIRMRDTADIDPDMLELARDARSSTPSMPQGET